MRGKILANVMKKRSELFFSLILVPIDFMMMIAGFVAAYIVRVKIDARPTAYHIAGMTYVRYLVVLLPIWIIIFALTGLYNLSSTRSRLGELVRILIATASGVMVLIFLDFFSRKPIFPSKSVPIYGFLFSFILIFLARFIVRAIQQYLFRFNIGVHNVVIVGQSTAARELRDKLSQKHSGYNVVNKTIQTDKDWDIGMLERYHQDYNLDEVIQADHGLSESKVVEIIGFCDQNHIAYKYVPSLAGLYRANVTTSTLVGVPIVEMIQTPLEGWGRIVKRIFDVFISSLALIILSPVFLVIGLVIKLTDPGPVFYRHRRISKGGKTIEILKFRSMYLKYCDGGKYSGKSLDQILQELGDQRLIDEFKRDFKLKNDPRVTRFGRFLRRTSLDELPQLVNVWKGEISLVGPRPIIAQELTKFGERAARLLAIKPGMTGLWAISGRSDISYEERAKLEIYYVENWSLMLDILILFKTAASITKGNNGY